MGVAAKLRLAVAVHRLHPGRPWSLLPLWVSLNLGYRYYAQHLHEKTEPSIAIWNTWPKRRQSTASRRPFGDKPRFRRGAGRRPLEVHRTSRSLR